MALVKDKAGISVLSLLLQQKTFCIRRDETNFHSFRSVDFTYPFKTLPPFRVVFCYDREGKLICIVILRVLVHNPKI